MKYNVVMGDTNDHCYGLSMGSWKGKEPSKVGQKITTKAGAFNVMSVNTQQKQILVKMNQ